MKGAYSLSDRRAALSLWDIGEGVDMSVHEALEVTRAFNAHINNY